VLVPLDGWRNIAITLKMPEDRNVSFWAKMSKRVNACLQQLRVCQTITISELQDPLTGSHPTRLLTTRLRIVLAMGWTAYLLALAIQGIIRRSHAGWLLPQSVLFHGWGLTAFNVVIYGEICWIAFWCIRHTIGRERLFMAGMFANILLWPAKMLLPHWAFAIRHVGAFGLAVATLAALTMLLDSSNQTDSDRANAAV
jgi:hypothetical protein